jgi:hypothetical protein
MHPNSPLQASNEGRGLIQPGRLRAVVRSVCPKLDIVQRMGSKGR